MPPLSSPSGAARACLRVSKVTQDNMCKVVLIRKLGSIVRVQIVIRVNQEVHHTYLNDLS